MPSVKSYFNPTLFRKNLTRFWPIWGLYLFIWILALPLNFLNQGFEGGYALRTLYTGAGMALCFGILAAMAVFSYLYNGKSVQLMHSLPVTRETLFLTNYLSGLLFLLGPNVLVFFLSVLTSGMGFHHSLILWLAAQSLMCLFFYSFAVFCAMFTGNLLALPVFYGILNGLAAGLAAVLDELMGQFLFGYAGTSALDNLILWLTPVARIYNGLGVEIRGNIYILEGMPYMLLYGLLAVPLTIAALLLYRRRRLEAAGDLVSVSWVRPVFKYGVAFCVAVTLGSYLYYTFRSLMPAQRWGILLPLIFAGLLGYFVAEMLLKKRFHVFSGGWKGCLVFSLALVCAFIVTSNDLVGFNRTPARATIASVRLSGISTTPYDTANYSALTLTQAEDIDAALALHSTIVANRAALQAEEAARAQNRNVYSSTWRLEPLPDGTQVDINYSNTTTFYIDYTLTNGSTMRRSYTLPLQLDRLNQSGSIEAGLATLLNRPALVEQSYWRDVPADARLVDATITMNPYSKNEGDLPTSVEGEEARDALLAAVKADMAAGRLGRRYLFEDAERYTNCYYNDLTFSFYRPGSDDDDILRQRDWQVTVTLQASATETLKVLRDLGYTDGNQLITWSEYYKHDGNVKYPDTVERYVD